MNRIQQISLKLKLGIDPASKLTDEELRALWREASRKRAETPETEPRGRSGGAPSRRAA